MTHLQTLAAWMRAPSRTVFDTAAYARARTLHILEEKFVDLRRRQRYLEMLEAYRAAVASGKTHKRWVSERRSSSRRSHVHAHGQTIPIEDDFTIGNERLFLPSDPRASFAETANCGCSVVFERMIVPQVVPAARRGARTRLPNGRLVTPAEALRLSRERDLLEQIREIEPTYQSLRGPNQVPSTGALRNMQAYLRGIQRRLLRDLARKFDNDGQASIQATLMGFRPTPHFSHGARIFRKGNRYISRDVNVHSGGVWKSGPSVRSLKIQGAREGTYNRDLSVRIGD